MSDALLISINYFNCFSNENKEKKHPELGNWMEQLRRSVRVKHGKHQSEGIPSIKGLCKEINMSERIYRELVTGDNPNLCNYLRVIFWCIDHSPAAHYERQMLELAIQLKREFE